MIEEIRISSEKEYQPSVSTAINRRTRFDIKDGQMITQHSYTIGKKEYLVNSIFDLNNKHTVTDGIKRLIDDDFDGAA